MTEGPLRRYRVTIDEPDGDVRKRTVFVVGATSPGRLQLAILKDQDFKFPINGTIKIDLL